ncbi:acetylxylan esterase [Streptomyces sp. NPDC059442]|uniref:acetylxylan esterase n=1 Tax=unclassified Streptomyces TaxID=2593676 RepID=UPI0036934376
MPLTDLPLDQLVDYRAAHGAPADFWSFWQETLADARSADQGVRATAVRDTLLSSVDVFDVRFPGWAGEPIAAWLIVPAGTTVPLPTVVSFAGYGSGRGLPTDHLLFPSAGLANLVVDSRGQGHDTPDRDPGRSTQWVEGFMTRGIDKPHHHYYRRLITDCARAVDAARSLAQVDPDRIVVQGASQGGGLALAVAGLTGDRIAGTICDVPFLCDFRRGADTASAGPYVELVNFFRHHSPRQVDRSFATLDYFDAVHFAARATAPALFSVGLMDPTCPPSTVYGAFNSYAGDKHMETWRFGDHGGGYGASRPGHLAWLHHHDLLATSGRPRLEAGGVHHRASEPFPSSP